MIFFIVILLSLVVVVLFFFWRRHPLHLSIKEVLQLLAEKLPLKNPRLQRYPSPTLVGDYFGYRVTLEGTPKKISHHTGIKTRFLGTLSLPKYFGPRIFLQTEKLKASLKPIAGLKLVETTHGGFNQYFLLLASDPSLAKVVFQPYLCGKFFNFSELDWKLDVQGKEAHFELWQTEASFGTLCEIIKLMIEFLNALLVAKPA